VLYCELDLYTMICTHADEQFQQLTVGLGLGSAFVFFLF